MREQNITFSVMGMTCANCAGNIERAVGKLEGIREVSVNFATEMVKIKKVRAGKPGWLHQFNINLSYAKLVKSQFLTYYVFFVADSSVVDLLSINDMQS